MNIKLTAFFPYEDKKKRIGPSSIRTSISIFKKLLIYVDLLLEDTYYVKFGSSGLSSLPQDTNTGPVQTREPWGTPNTTVITILVKYLWSNHVLFESVHLPTTLILDFSNYDSQNDNYHCIGLF